TQRRRQLKTRRLYSIYRRKTDRRKNGKPVFVFYYRTWNGATRSAGKSTGKETVSEARAFVEAQIKSGTLATGPDPTLRDYCKTWWLWDECRYVRRRRERGSISQHWVNTQRGLLDRWILPSLGDTRLSALNTRTVEDWLYKLRDESTLSATSCNHVLGCLGTILREGVEEGDLPKDPCRRVGKLREDRKRKGILDISQVRLLFDEGKIGTYWKGDLRLFTLNLFACTTGARLGECQALQRQHVHEGWVGIEHGWRRLEGLVEPKKKSARAVPLTDKTEDALNRIMAMSPWQDLEDLVFPGMDGRHPIGQKVVQHRFGDALVALGISEEQRKEQVLSFHGWRVFYNSLLRGKISEARLRALTGHKSVSMSDLYTRWDVKDLPVREHETELSEPLLLGDYGARGGASGLGQDRGRHPRCG
ncbi:MAG: site-specific integrase, partial [Armatimonadetes bacterium]|nr:site-specific integrase [Armatimonadota bacterium]